MLDPAGGRPDPVIEVTYPKSGHVCQIFCFWDGIPTLSSKKNSVHLAAARSRPDPGKEVTYSKSDYKSKIICFWGKNYKFVIKNKFQDTWQLLDPAGSRPLNDCWNENPKFWQQK